MFHNAFHVSSIAVTIGVCFLDEYCVGATKPAAVLERTGENMGGNRIGAESMRLADYSYSVLRRIVACLAARSPN
jgi:hypothetical protein